MFPIPMNIAAPARQMAAISKEYSTMSWPRSQLQNDLALCNNSSSSSARILALAVHVSSATPLACKRVRVHENRVGGGPDALHSLAGANGQRRRSQSYKCQQQSVLH